MKDNTIIIIVAIVSVLLIELYALSLGMNGKMMAGTMALIGTLAGLKIETPAFLKAA
jgi:hypothetical protein